MPRCRRSCLTFWTSCPRWGGYQPPAGACYAPLQTLGQGLAASRHTDTAPLSGGAAPSYFSPFVGNAGTGPAISADPHPAGAAVSRPRAHTMRPYKRGGGNWRRHGTPAPIPYPAGRSRLIFFPFRGERRNGTGHLSCPASRRGGYQPPAGACYAPLQMPGWGLAAARHAGAAPLSGRAAPSYFLSFSWGTPERRPPPQVTRIPQGRLSAARGRMLCAPANAGVGAGGGTAHRYRPFPFRKIRRTTFPNAVRRLIRLPSALHGAGHCKNSSCTAGF